MKNRLARVFNPGDGPHRDARDRSRLFPGPDHRAGAHRSTSCRCCRLRRLVLTRGILRSVVPASPPKPMRPARQRRTQHPQGTFDEEIAMDIEDAIRLNARRLASRSSSAAHSRPVGPQHDQAGGSGLRYGIPVMAVTAVGKDMVRDAQYFRLACRIFAELGAHIVKTYYWRRLRDRHRRPARCRS